MRSLLVTLLLLLNSLSLQAAEALQQDTATRWLQRMADALHQLNYDGVFVYQHGEQLTTMRLIHGHDARGERERLISLTGAAREVIRDKEQVTCILPDSRSLIIERKGKSSPGFPYLLSEQVDEIGDSYRFELGQQERVAGRMTQQILILPRDAYRYRYGVWLDKDNGMLLKSELYGEHGLIEQFMFTHLKFLPSIRSKQLDPSTSQESMLGYRQLKGDVHEPVKPAEQSWKVGKLPQGFHLKQYQYQYQSRSNPLALAANKPKEAPVHHLVFSDGLSTVSIFIERLQAGESLMSGAETLGAVNTYSVSQGQTQITAVGEVPLQTVRLMAESVHRRR